MALPQYTSELECPYCHSHSGSKVVDSRGYENRACIRRRRECLSCGKRYSTAETVTLKVIDDLAKAEMADGFYK